MGLLMGQKLVKSGSTWARLCRTHISETVGWIYTIWNSMELSKPVVVQHHGHLNFTLDFQGKSLKMLYLRNGWADWHGTKGMWVDRMLDPHCDLEQWPHPWPWPLIFKFWHQILKWFFPGIGGPRCPLSPKRPINLISLSPGMGGPIDIERKEYEPIRCYTYFVTFSYDLGLTLDFQG